MKNTLQTGFARDSFDKLRAICAAILIATAATSPACAQTYGNIHITGTSLAENLDLGQTWYVSPTYGLLHPWLIVGYANSTASSISGFSSLSAVSPTNLNVNIGQMNLTALTNNGTTVTEYYSGNVVTISGGGISVVGTNALLNIVTVEATDTATGYGQFRLTGPTSDPFYQEVHGLGAGDIVTFTVDHFNPVSNNTTNYTIYATDGTVSAAPTPLRISAISRQGNDIRITWSTLAGQTNIVEASPSLTGTFAGIGSQIVVSGNGAATTNYLESGAATNGTARYYRIRAK